MRNINKFISWIISHRFITHIILGIAVIGYSIQAWVFSQQQRSLLDEGNYLLKGYLFATGRYVPYQDYGTWTNKMPLSFLIPGYVQKIFGPGLSTGRYYAFALSILILIAAVIIGYRLGGKWGGALTATILTLNPAPLKIYTKVLTEGLTALLLLITILLVLGKSRPLWQILLGSFVAGLIPVTRINLFPILPLVIIYLFWEHGPRKGFYGLLVSLIPYLGVHLIYWPGILQLWAKWIPTGLIEELDIWKGRFGDAVSLRQPDKSVSERFMAFSQGIRFHFSAVVGVFTAVCLWPKHWSDRSHQRSAVFLLVLFLVLFFAHLGAVTYLDFNIHAFDRYLCAFSFLGIFLVLITWDNWNFDMTKWKQIIIGLGIVFFTLTIGYSVSEQGSVFGIWIKDLLENLVQTFEKGYFSGNVWNWWTEVQGLLGLDYSTTLKVFTLGLSIIGVILTLLGATWLFKRFFSQQIAGLSSFQMPQALISFFILGIFLSPTKLLGSGNNFYDCKPGVVRSYQTAVRMTSRFVNVNDQVFWIGKDTQVVLLGLLEEKDIKIFPQQLNSYNSFRMGGNGDQLARAGFWNDSLAQEWINRSQVLLFEEQAYSDWYTAFQSSLDLSDFELVGETNNTACSFAQRIYIYNKLVK